MKKTLAMLLVFVMLLGLCACSSNDSQTTDPSNSSQAATEGTQNPTDGTEGTTGTTQAPTDEPTTAPTDEPTTAPTDEPTTPPTQAPTETPTTPPTTQPATCSHSWKAATCTAPKTCSKCGATEGNAAGHSWKDATCTAAKTCTKCGATEGNAAGHSWNNATCTAPKTCSKCGTTEGSAAGHSYSNGTCSVCGTADPSFKQLTEGAWIFKNEWSTVVLTFGADNIVSIYALDVVNTAEEFRKTWNEFTADEYSWYSVYDIGGTHYVAREEITYDSLYTVNGQTVSFEIFQSPESITWDGYTVTAAPQSGSGWLNNMGKGAWLPSGVSIVDDLGPYFG